MTLFRLLAGMTLALWGVDRLKSERRENPEAWRLRRESQLARRQLRQQEA